MTKVAVLRSIRHGRVRRRVRWGASLACLLAVALGGCTPALTPTPSPTPFPSSTPPAPQQLRVHNAGPLAIRGLVVGFTIESFAPVRVAFGDIAPGATTDYQTVPNGVLAYAFYSFQMDGREVEQAVMDFVGMRPLPGRDFTYSLDFDPGRWSQNEAIRLLGVATDK